MRWFCQLTTSSLVAVLSLASCGSNSGSPALEIIVQPDGGGDFGGDPGGMDVLEPGIDGGPGCVGGDPCDDGDPCTWGEICMNGVCVGGTTTVCDDGRDCTSDACDGKGNCEYVLLDDFCLISGMCRAGGETDPANECVRCDPQQSLDTWTNLAEGTCDPTPALGPCDGAVTDGSCVDGVCVPEPAPSPKDCDDGNPCTDDHCYPDNGCVNKPTSGAVCWLTDACEAGTCNQGQCIVPPGAGCDDLNPCTENTCDPVTGCTNTPLDQVPCPDESVCTVESSCVSGSCLGLDVNCNDGNICTLDGCDPVTGCFHDLDDNECCEKGQSKCDDGNPCTDDGCSEDGAIECIYTFNQASCDDGDPCTVVDSCSDGDCLGMAKDCNDGNPCTLDSCTGGVCANEAHLEGSQCDDGLECSTSDHCKDGQCVADTSECVCQPVFWPVVSKMTSMSIAATGNPGDGLDLDGDPGTCTPATDCSAGIDNSLGPLSSLGNDAIQESMADGDIIILMEHRDFHIDGTPYSIAVYVGKDLDPSNPACDVQTQTCAYLVDNESLNVDCNPLVSLDNAVYSNGKLTAGGAGYTFPFDLPILGDVSLHVDLFYATIHANVTLSGNKVTAMDGILGGAVPKAQLKAAIESLPPDTDLPLPKEQIITLLDLLVQPDIDGDGDGVKESASIGIHFTAIAGTISGLE
ncbi:MAG: hypothetical protein ISR64_02250 [Deltaproteobacteria bacterium]|nr:hypothetical protein [Deltaproteobacteria bacterium]